MEIVGAGLRDRADNAAGVAAILRIISVLDDLKFANGFDSRQGFGCAARAALGVIDVSAIEQEQILVVAGAGD